MTPIFPLKSLSLIFLISLLVCCSLRGQDAKTTYDPQNNIDQPIQYVSTPQNFSAEFEFDCTTDFFTVNNNGEVQKWNLADGSISGGEIILSSPGGSLSFCGDPEPTFYTANFPDNGIQKFNENNNAWELIETEIPLLNNGCHLNHQYFYGLVEGINRLIYYYDGTTFTLLDSLIDEQFTVVDIAVDTLGQAWTFIGPEGALNSRINVYDSNGLVNSYDYSFESIAGFGSAFINGTLYMGFAGTNNTLGDQLVPITIENDSPQIGPGIPFPYLEFFDMASCQESLLFTNTAEFKQQKEVVNIYPNPTKGLSLLESTEDILWIKVYNNIGQLLINSENDTVIDLSPYSSGTYYIQVDTSNGSFFKSIVKK